jgi:lipoate-protein ligase A
MDRRRPGALNMALDEALMTFQEKRSLPPTLRLYGWDPPCVSLGYFQRTQGEIDLEACGRAGVDVVRRPTGGRAVLHDDELTYCLVIPQDMLPGSVLETYRVISGGLLQGLAYLGISGQLAQPARRARSRRRGADPGEGAAAAGEGAGADPGEGAAAAGEGAGADPGEGVAAAGDRESAGLGESGGQDEGPDAPGGACFDSPSWYEMVVGGRKIIGSAQTRRNGVILQHGSLLVSFDPGRLASLVRSRGASGRERLSRRLREGVTSISEQLGRTPRPGEVETAIACGMARALGLRLARAGYAFGELELTRKLYGEKYGSKEWTFRR